MLLFLLLVLPLIFSFLFFLFPFGFVILSFAIVFVVIFSEWSFFMSLCILWWCYITLVGPVSIFKWFSLSYFDCLSFAVVPIPLFLSLLCTLFLMFGGRFYSYKFLVHTAINEYGYVTLKSNSGLIRKLTTTKNTNTKKNRKSNKKKKPKTKRVGRRIEEVCYEVSQGIISAQEAQ